MDVFISEEARKIDAGYGEDTTINDMFFGNVAGNKWLSKT